MSRKRRTRRYLVGFEKPKMTLVWGFANKSISCSTLSEAKQRLRKLRKIPDATLYVIMPVRKK